MALISTEPVLARAFARMQQHVPDDGSCALAVLHDLVEIAAVAYRAVSLISAAACCRLCADRAPVVAHR